MIFDIYIYIERGCWFFEDYVRVNFWMVCTHIVLSHLVAMTSCLLPSIHISLIGRVLLPRPSFWIVCGLVGVE
jgi:hypothetical protein